MYQPLLPAPARQGVGRGFPKSSTVRTNKDVALSGPSKVMRELGAPAKSQDSSLRLRIIQRGHFSAPLRPRAPVWPLRLPRDRFAALASTKIDSTLQPIPLATSSRINGFRCASSPPHLDGLKRSSISTPSSCSRVVDGVAKRSRIASLHENLSSRHKAASPRQF